MAPVGLVRGRHHDATDGVAHHPDRARRLEQVVGAAHVRLEGRERRAVRGADDRLRGEVEDRPDLVLVQDPGERVVVEQVGLHHVAALLESLDPKQREGGRVAAGHHHPRALVEQPPGQPGAHEALGAGHEDRLAGPADRVHSELLRAGCEAAEA